MEIEKQAYLLSISAVATGDKTGLLIRGLKNIIAKITRADCVQETQMKNPRLAESNVILYTDISLEMA